MRAIPLKRMVFLMLSLLFCFAVFPQAKADTYSGPNSYIEFLIDAFHQQNIARRASLKEQSPIMPLHDSWAPSNRLETESYFRYHKAEVISFMKAFRIRLGYTDIPLELVEHWGSLHDSSKVESLSSLKGFGYKGWSRKLALPFLSAVLGFSKERLDSLLPKTEYLEVDIATRLFFCFGFSQENVAKIFSNENERANVLAELKDLRKSLNQIEDSMKESTEIYRGLKNSQDFYRLRLLEYLADFVVRTENPLSTYEYGKHLIRTSTLLGDIEGDGAYVDEILKREGGPVYDQFDKKELVLHITKLEENYPQILRTNDEFKKLSADLKGFPILILKLSGNKCEDSFNAL